MVFTVQYHVYLDVFLGRTRCKSAQDNVNKFKHICALMRELDMGCVMNEDWWRWLPGLLAQLSRGKHPHQSVLKICPATFLISPSDLTLPNLHLSSPSHTPSIARSSDIHIPRKQHLCANRRQSFTAAVAHAAITTDDDANKATQTDKAPRASSTL